MNASTWLVSGDSVCGYYIKKDNKPYADKLGTVRKWKRMGFAQRFAEKLNDAEYPYKTLKKLGIHVYYNPDFKMDYVDSDSLDNFLYKQRNLEYRKEVDIMMNGQTCGPLGMYPCDLDAALCRLETGKLTGSQKFWD